MGWRVLLWLFANKNNCPPAHGLYCLACKHFYPPMPKGISWRSAKFHAKKRTSGILPVNRHHKSRPHSLSNMGVHFPAVLAGHCRGSIIISGRFHRILPHHGQYSHGYFSLGNRMLFLLFFPGNLFPCSRMAYLGWCFPALRPTECVPDARI